MTVPIKINVWRTAQTERDDLDTAVRTLEETFAPQVDCPVAVQVQEVLDLQSDSFDSYGAYLEAFQQAIDAESGAINVCLYAYLTQGIDEALEMGLERVDDVLGDRIPDDVYLVCGMDPSTDESTSEEPPWVGYTDSGLQSDEPTFAVVNASLRTASFIYEGFFENVLMHEVLHAVVASDGAPVRGEDHSYGTNADGANSPLLTAYAESLSPNDPPTAGCGQPDGVQQVDDHTTTLSPCTVDEVSRYMGEEFGG